jgi:hypothetical protein
MTLRTALKTLLGLALGLPLIQSLLFWVAGLLTAMGDDGGASFLNRANMVLGVIWLASLTALVVALALQVLEDKSHLDE